MSEITEKQGHCLCGAVHISAKAASDSVGACHCRMCRRWGGGPFMEIDCGVDVSISGGENVSVFESSAWAERGFCRICGTHLFCRLKEAKQHMIPVGLFDGGKDLTFDTQVFIDEKPSFYRFANATRDMTGAEIFAMYAPSE